MLLETGKRNQKSGERDLGRAGVCWVVESLVAMLGCWESESKACVCVDVTQCGDTVWQVQCDAELGLLSLWSFRFSPNKYVNVCVYVALLWTNVPSLVYSHFVLSVPRISSQSTMTLTKIKQLLKIY